MPVYGQINRRNDRILSLLASIVCNTNELYDGHRPFSLPAALMTSNVRVRQRPVFREAILRKAKMLAEYSHGRLPKQQGILEILLVKDEDSESAASEIADFCSQLSATSIVDRQLVVTLVDSHAIRNKGASQVGDSRLFVALGSSIRGLWEYLTILRSAEGNNRARRMLGVVVVDPPMHLWKSYGDLLLGELESQRIPSLLVGYGNNDDIRRPVGNLLSDSLRFPSSLIVIANAAARIFNRESVRVDASNTKDSFANMEDCCFWLARLITKYAEATYRIENPPGTPNHWSEKPSEPSWRGVHETGRSKL